MCIGRVYFGEMSMNNRYRPYALAWLIVCLVLAFGCTNSGDSGPTSAELTQDPAADGGSGGVTITPPVPPIYLPPPVINYAYLNATVSTVAGAPGQSGSIDGIGSNARLVWPRGLAYDGLNTIYFADYSSHTLKSLDISTMTVTTLFGTPYIPNAPPQYTGQLWGPAYLTISGGVTYFTDSIACSIKDDLNSVIAGIPVPILGGVRYADGLGIEAKFNQPKGLVELNGYLYVADGHNQVIRRVDMLSGTYDVTTFAGHKGEAGGWDGTGTGAYFNNPCGMATDGFSLFVADQGSHTIRIMNPATAQVLTIAGKAGEPGHLDGDSVRNARFFLPQDVAIDPIGRVVVADTGNHAIRIVEPGIVYTVGGGIQNRGHLDGPVSSASFLSPTGVELVGTDIFVSDSGNRVIRRIQ
jgi:hypothetical protein